MKAYLVKQEVENGSKNLDVVGEAHVSTPCRGSGKIGFQVSKGKLIVASS
jgi:hypothetical protein